MIFWGLKFWPKVIFLGPLLGLLKTPGCFWVAENTEGFFWGVAKKGLKDFFGYAKKVVIFLGSVEPPAPVIKICEWGPWAPDPLEKDAFGA